MQASDSAADSQPEAGSKLPDPQASHVSHAFHAQLSPAELKRSLIFAALGSTIGMVMYGVIQGTALNFFLEDLSLKDRIPWFTGLLWLSGGGSVVGSWIQERWGHRRLLTIACCGGSRLVWLFMGLLPLIWPDKIANGGFFYWISGCTVFFYFVHSVGANAWLAWMSDLVPPEYQSKFWSLRQFGTYTTNPLARLGFGYLLEQHHKDMRIYAIIFGIAALTGVMDVSMYFFVAHRQPKIVPVTHGVLSKSWTQLAEPSFQKLCGVYLLWLAANCIMGPTVYYFFREHVEMGAWEISLCMTISIFVGFALMSPFWGMFANREGHRRAVIACLILQNVCTFIYPFCRAHSVSLVTAASTLEQIGVGGVNLFMFPMLIDYTKRKGGGRAVGMAAFTFLLSIVGFLASVVADRHIYNGVAWLFHVYRPDPANTPNSAPVYIGVMVIAFGLRSIALVLALKLPACDKQLAAGPRTRILHRVSVDSLRAAQNFVAFATSGFISDDDDEKKSA